MENLPDVLLFLTQPWPRAALIFASSILLTLFSDTIGRRFLERLVSATKTDLDDQILAVVRRPTSLTLLMGGLWFSMLSLDLTAEIQEIAWSLCVSAAVIFWTSALVRIANLVIEAAASHPKGLIQDKTQPLFDMASKVLIVGFATYFFFHAWGINLTAWVAGAGVTGIVLGLAAQDTLSNLFAGLFILTDAPFELGDYLQLDDGVRGRVTTIGLRSTRIITNNLVEIIIPNAELASARITNESGGPEMPARIEVGVGVAYGVDIDDVRRFLMEEAVSLEGIALGDRFQPLVRFMNFGASSLDLVVIVWPLEPAHREDIIDALNTRIYKRLGRENIEIPYPKRDVYLYPQGGNA